MDKVNKTLRAESLLNKTSGSEWSSDGLRPSSWGQGVRYLNKKGKGWRTKRKEQKREVRRVCLRSSFQCWLADATLCMMLRCPWCFWCGAGSVSGHKLTDTYRSTMTKRRNIQSTAEKIARNHDLYIRSQFTQLLVLSTLANCPNCTHEKSDGEGAFLALWSKMTLI